MRYPSSITFLYYNDIEVGSTFIEQVLLLEKIMDQGFARIYQISPTSYLGIVLKKENTPYQGDTLVSINTSNVDKEHERIDHMEEVDCTEIIEFPSIPLRSFFFTDSEGHRFEIQEFLAKYIKKPPIFKDI